mmetsp:Transcript_747/g.1562  ORF Transcript_747/g.1562 Transcript_747/m.1562 type:complete len:349 (-) Transcript_747:147-1193(-)
MGHYNHHSHRGTFSSLLPTTMASTMAMLLWMLVLSKNLTVNAFSLQHPIISMPSSAAIRASSSSSSTTALYGAMNRRNKHADMAAKMAEAKRQRELADSGNDDDDDTATSSQALAESEDETPLSASEIKERNDRQRFADLLENSLTSGGGSDLDKGYYLTEAQENESADAVFRGVVRLYEGDPAPTAPFAQLLNIENGEPIGKGGMKRFVPWEGSQSSASRDYLVVITDPRPKSLELRTAMKRLVGSLSGEALKKCLVINTDTPAENRRFLKKNLPTASDGSGTSGGSSLRIMCDRDKEWMREYTALGEKRYSMTVFVLRDGRVEKIAREVEAEMLPLVVKNAISSLS